MGERQHSRTRMTTALLATLVVALALSGMGCAHTMIVETEPAGALVTINGKVQGEGPVVTRQFTSTGGRLYLTVEAENYETAHVVVTQSEWFLWPAIVAAVPLFGVPFVVIPFVGPVITVVWGVLTSPTLLSLMFLQKYPEKITVQLKPRLPNGLLQPTDSWLIPDDLDPNPPPLPPLPPVADEPVAEQPPPSPPVKQPPQPEGGNPVP